MNNTEHGGERHEDDDWKIVEENLRRNGVASEEEARDGQRYYRRDGDTFSVLIKGEDGSE